MECWHIVSLYDSESLATEQNDIWNTYLGEVNEDDKRITDARKEDANGILVFVSLSIGPPVRLNDKQKDRSFLRNCWRLHH